MNATTGAEWAQMVSLSVGLYAAMSAPYFLLVEAEVWAWPRPVTAAVDRVRCSLETGRLVPVWQPAIHASHDVNYAIGTGQLAARRFLRDATITPGDAR